MDQSKEAHGAPPRKRPSTLRLTPGLALLVIFVAIAFQAGVQGTMTAWIGTADAMLFSVLAFALTATVFSLLSISGKRWRVGPKMPARLMIVMNIATAVTFISFYASISMIPAATTGALQSAFGPIAVALLSFAVTRTSSSRLRWLIAIVLVLLGTVLAAQTWERDAGDSGTAVVGVLLAILAGWGTASVTLISRSLGERRVSPVVVTAHRFHLSFIVAAVIWIASGPPVPEPSHVLLLLGLGVLAVTIPLFLLQVGLQKARPFSAMLIVTTLPALTYLVQLLSGESTDPFHLLLIILIIGVSMIGMRSERADSTVLNNSLRES